MPTLVDSIKSQGLVLVTDKSLAVETGTNYSRDAYSRLPEGIDGVMRSNGVLRFNESIDM